MIKKITHNFINVIKQNNFTKCTQETVELIVNDMNLNKTIVFYIPTRTKENPVHQNIQVISRYIYKIMNEDKNSVHNGTDCKNINLNPLFIIQVSRFLLIFLR